MCVLLSRFDTDWNLKFLVCINRCKFKKSASCAEINF